MYIKAISLSIHDHFPLSSSLHQFASSPYRPSCPFPYFPRSKLYSPCLPSNGPYTGDRNRFRKKRVPRSYPFPQVARSIPSGKSLSHHTKEDSRPIKEESRPIKEEKPAEHKPSWGQSQSWQNQGIPRPLSFWWESPIPGLLRSCQAPYGEYYPLADLGNKREVGVMVTLLPSCQFCSLSMFAI